MKLAIFDIDGTLTSAGQSYVLRRQVFIDTLKQVYGIMRDELIVTPSHGMIDPQIAYTNVIAYGLSPKEFNDKFDEYKKTIYEVAKQLSATHHIRFVDIPGSVQCVKCFHEARVPLWLFTGNFESMAWWKLETAYIDRSFFDGGTFSDREKDKRELSHKLWQDLRQRYGDGIKKTDCVLLGDSINDVMAAREIGIPVIITLESKRVTRDAFVDHQPDLLVDTLMDPRVFELIG